MITINTKGMYQLVITKDRNKILYLDNQAYVWRYVKGIGELLCFSKHTHKAAYILAQGNYQILNVKNEPKYIDLKHLELSIGNGKWQGYLLLTGLPSAKKIRSKIVPTSENIPSEKYATTKSH